MRRNAIVIPNDKDGKLWSVFTRFGWQIDPHVPIRKRKLIQKYILASEPMGLDEAVALATRLSQPN